MDLSAVILAGGESRRMGRDKAWIEFDRQPLIARALSTVRQLGVGELFISGRAGEDYSALRCPVLFDLEPGCGPLGGVERALRACASPLLLVLAVDLPHMTATCLQRLAERCDRLTGAVPRLDGELEPLAAVYPKRCHEIAVDCLAHSRRAARDFAQACLREGAVRAVPIPAAEAPCFVNWNRPEDLWTNSTGSGSQA
jgi:molybdopterin-guanine dinucleotide biosynthesis protein A